MSQVEHHPTVRIEPPRRNRLGQALLAIGQFLRGLITLPLRIFRGKRGKVDEITVYAAHPSFFLWLLIVTGFVCAWIVRRDNAAAGVTGWLYLWVLVYFLMSVLYDFSTRKLLLWLGIFALIWLASAYVEHLKNVVLLGNVFQYLGGLKPKLDPGTVTVLSWIMLLPWIGSLFHMMLNGRKTFTPNEIGESFFGEGSELTDRSGLRFRTQYRDVLETILTFGGGDLLAVDNHQNVIKRWDNVIGLFFVWNDLDRVLHQRAALIDDGDEREPQ